jgi:5-(carboxyamino)imidazole ribonucleotide synthase
MTAGPEVTAPLPGILPGGGHHSGVMGGGQLGRMFVQAAQAMGYFTAVLDPDVTSPAGLVAHYHIDADYLTSRAWPADAALRGHHHRIRERARRRAGDAGRTPAGGAGRPTRGRVPGPRAPRRPISARSGVPCAPFAVIDTPEPTWPPCPTSLLPGILKTARLGYDGKGQVRVADRAALAAAWADAGRGALRAGAALPLAPSSA